jgi:hypothetical protein
MIVWQGLLRWNRLVEHPSSQSNRDEIPIGYFASHELPKEASTIKRIQDVPAKDPIADQPRRTRLVIAKIMGVARTIVIDV